MLLNTLIEFCFTFQSGYIQIDKFEIIKAIFNRFTFQSGYIQIIPNGLGQNR